jgi:hypothetical protein
MIWNQCLDLLAVVAAAAAAAAAAGVVTSAASLLQVQKPACGMSWEREI